jgi:predicted amidohydrolase YtcJ
VSASQPVFVRRCDGHSAACNTRALRLAGITRATPDPPGARFERDADGEPNGVLTELGAREVVEAARPTASYDQRVRDLADLNRHYAQRGIVAVGDMMATTLTEPLSTFRDAERIGLRQQCALYYAWEHGVPELTDDERRGRVKIAGVKLFMDGAYSNRTAWVAEAYPGSHDHGLRLTTDQQALAAAQWARRNQVQVAIHAMGDAAINHVLDLFADQEPWLTDRPCIRIEHSSLVSPAMIARIASARMTIAVISHTIFYFAEYDSYARNLTETQARVAYPIKSFYDGLPYAALSSDCPATAWSDADDVFVSVKAAVTRRAYTGADIGSHEAITVPQALLLYTGRARGIAPLDDVGLVDDGFEASFVVLDRDVFTVPADEIDAVQVQETWIAGDQVYTAD